MNIIARIFNELTGQWFELRRKNRLVEKQISRLEDSRPQPNYEEPEFPLFDLDTLLRHLHQEQARRQIIEEKAKTNIIGITLAFTVILASVAFAPRIAEVGGNYGTWILWTFIGFQLSGIGLLIRGGWLALNTLRVAKVYVWTLEDERSNTTDEAQNAEILWYLQNNQLATTLKANLLDASYSCIRNGVAALAISAVLVSALMVYSSLANVVEPNVARPKCGTTKMSLINRHTDRYQTTETADSLTHLRASSQFRIRLPAEIAAIST